MAHRVGPVDKHSQELQQEQETEDEEKYQTWKRKKVVYQQRVRERRGRKKDSFWLKVSSSAKIKNRIYAKSHGL